MADQAKSWSAAAAGYEDDFIDPYHPDVDNPLWTALDRLAHPKRTAADLGCGVGPLLPQLARRFGRVLGVDFAEGMLERARERCQGLVNVELHRLHFLQLSQLPGPVDVAVAVNSLVLPDSVQLNESLQAIRALLQPCGHLLGIVPAMDSVHYLTMLLVDRARQTGMPEGKARQNSAKHAEHCYYDFAFSRFHYKGLDQHFWFPFEVRYRLRQAGFRQVKLARVRLSWQQFGALSDLHCLPPPWDWFFHARVPKV
jgi:SAM-dependent methyltransferase